jgi:hypothetical protein
VSSSSTKPNCSPKLVGADQPGTDHGQVRCIFRTSFLKPLRGRVLRSPQTPAIPEMEDLVSARVSQRGAVLSRRRHLDGYREAAAEGLSPLIDDRQQDDQVALALRGPYEGYERLDHPLVRAPGLATALAIAILVCGVSRPRTAREPASRKAEGAAVALPQPARRPHWPQRGGRPGCGEAQRCNRKPSVRVPPSGTPAAKPPGPEPWSTPRCTAAEVVPPPPGGHRIPASLREPPRASRRRAAAASVP